MSETAKSSLFRLTPDAKKVLYVFLILIIELVVFQIGSGGKFLQPTNLMNAAVQASVIILIALGQMYVVITTGIDLSIGANVGLSGLLAAYAITVWHMPVPVGILIGIAAATIVGLCNGLIVVYLKITPFITTFVMQCIVRGSIYLILGDSSSIFGLPSSFTYLGTGRIFGFVPVPVVIAIVFASIFGFIISKTRTGRYTYFVGSNIEAAKLSGINTNMVLLKVYLISGFLAGITGILVAAQLGAATGQAGLNAELDAVAGTVIGGTSLLGGIGLPSATVIGGLVVGVLANGLTLMGVSGNWQLVAKGIVVLLAAALDMSKRSDAFVKYISKFRKTESEAGSVMSETRSPEEVRPEPVEEPKRVE